MRFFFFFWIPLGLGRFISIFSLGLGHVLNYSTFSSKSGVLKYRLYSLFYGTRLNYGALLAGPLWKALDVVRSYLFPRRNKGFIKKEVVVFFFFFSDIYVNEPGLDEVGKSSDHQLWLQMCVSWRPTWGHFFLLQFPTLLLEVAWIWLSSSVSIFVHRGWMIQRRKKLSAWFSLLRKKKCQK